MTRSSPIQLTAEKRDPRMIHKSTPSSREMIDKTQRQNILHASKIYKADAAVFRHVRTCRTIIVGHFIPFSLDHAIKDASINE